MIMHHDFSHRPERRSERGFGRRIPPRPPFAGVPVAPVAVAAGVVAGVTSARRSSPC
jgi:hypothetical protein